MVALSAFSRGCSRDELSRAPFSWHQASCRDLCFALIGVGCQFSFKVFFSLLFLLEFYYGCINFYV